MKDQNDDVFLPELLEHRSGVADFAFFQEYGHSLSTLIIPFRFGGVDSVVICLCLFLEEG